MNSQLGSLSDDDIRDIGQLVETLDRSRFDFLQLEVGDLRLVVGKSDFSPVLDAEPQRTAPSALPEAATPAQIAPPIPPVDDARRDQGREGTLPIVAPLLGRFYAQPEPGAPPFVSAGTVVTEDTTVGLIEVMKTFNAVRSGLTGIVTEICVHDADFVEYGQTLFLVLPNQTP